MDYARQQRDPARHMIGIGFVVLVHVLVVWALLSGLGSAVVQVIKKPLTATIIEEVKLPPPPPPPPPPPKRIVDPPKVQPPVETYVPPPEVPPPTTTGRTGDRRRDAGAAGRTARDRAARDRRGAAGAAAPAAKPAIRRGIVKISGDEPSYPREAIRAGVAKGRVVARLQIDEKGNVTDVNITVSEPPRRVRQGRPRRARNLEVQGRRRALRRRGRDQFLAQGLTKRRIALATAYDPRTSCEHAHCGSTARAGCAEALARYDACCSRSRAMRSRCITPGIASYQSGNLPQALERIRQAVVLEPGLPDAWSNLGLVLQASETTRRRSTCTRRPCRLAPDSVEFARQPRERACSPAGRHADAEAVARRLIARDGSLAKALVRPRARAAGRRAACLEALEAITQGRGPRAGARGAMPASRPRSRGTSARRDQARRTLEKALARHPMSAPLRFALACMLEQKLGRVARGDRRLRAGAAHRSRAMARRCRSSCSCAPASPIGASAMRWCERFRDGCDGADAGPVALRAAVAAVHPRGTAPMRAHVDRDAGHRRARCRAGARSPRDACGSAISPPTSTSTRRRSWRPACSSTTTATASRSSPTPPGATTARRCARASSARSTASSTCATRIRSRSPRRSGAMRSTSWST